MTTFRFWCQKVLPLVYDNSLSYYEVLCKVVDYINELINSDKDIINNVSNLRKDVDTIQSILDSGSKEEIDKIIREYIATMVFFGLNDEGYFVAYIPDNWGDISFGTTGLDVNVPIQPEYGHLVLIY